MSFLEMAMHMWPMWILGIVMIIAVWNSEHKDLLKITPKALLRWLGLISIATTVRLIAFSLAKQSGQDMSMIYSQLEAVTFIPWQGVLGTFWEDAAHGLPLVIISRWLSDKWYSKPINWFLTAFVMISFGLGHLYQGLWASLILMLYIPISIKMGKKHGFGTVMVGHVLYDLVTILTVKWMLGQL